MANSNYYSPDAYVIDSLENFDPTSFLKPFNFSIVGSRLAIERIVCKRIDQLVYCGFIHTGPMVSWLKLQPTYGGGKLLNLTLITSRTFENHADWDPVNLEISDSLLAVEAISNSGDDSQTRYPKILVYNITSSQFVWYSISLQDCAVTTIEVLSFIMTTITSSDNTPRMTIIVANRRDNSNLLMYYESRPMVLSITEVLSKSQLNEFSMLISNSTSIPLNQLLSYSSESVTWSNFELFATAFFGILIIVVLGVWIFKKLTNDNYLEIDRSLGSASLAH